MSWPLASHFSAMLQNPRIAFRDPQLQACRIQKDAMNQPRPWSGAFAVVYKGIDPDGKGPFAVRVFTTESPQRRERYDRISEYLKTRRLECLVDFEYRDRSIRSGGDGKWYPLILMDWVQGATLFEWARERCLAGDRAALAAVARQWVAVVKELADAQIAHGDLQHANVMVADAGQLKLVDYDCMCVPALVGRRNLEVGVEPYQHPDRNETTLLAPHLDNFSAVVIYVALSALAADPGLWQKYVEQPGYDKLLFRTEDLRAPAGSALCGDLKHSPDAEVRELTDQLLQLVSVPMDQVPPLGQVVGSYARIEQLLLQQQWEIAVKLLNRRKRFRDAPDHLKPLIRQAYEHVCRKQAWEAFQAIAPQADPQHDRQLLKAWNEALFAGFEPAEQQRARMAAARERLELLDRLQQRIQQSSSAVTLFGEHCILEVASQLPQGYQQDLQARVELAAQRIKAVARMEQALGQALGEAEVIAAWQDVVEYQCLELLGPQCRPRVELARQRLRLLKALGEIPSDLPVDQLDRRMLAVWREDLLGDCPEAAAWRPACEAAARRKQLLPRLQAAVESRNAPVIVELVEDPCLAGYPMSAGWAAVIKSAQQGAARARALVCVLRDAQRSSLLAAFDVRLIRQYAEQFAPYRSLLCEWTRSEILPAENLGLRPAVARGSLVRADQAQGAYRVRWTWPPARFAEQCLLAVCPDQPGPEDDPAALHTLHRSLIDRQSWESGGGSRLLYVEPGWAGSCVVVWARVDLGFQSFYSHPLVLGRLEGRRAGGWKGWRIFSLLRSRSSRAEKPASGALGPCPTETRADE